MLLFLNNNNSNKVSFFSCIFLFFFLLPVLNAESPEVVQVDDYPDSLSYVSSSWPLATILSTNSPFVQHTATLISHFSAAEKRVQTLVYNSTRHGTDPDIVPCNLGRAQSIIPWIKWAKATFTDRQWNPPPPFLCNTQYAQQNPKVRRAMDQRAKILNDFARRLAQSAGMQWSNPTAVWRQNIETRTRQCFVNVEGGVKIDNVWYVLTRITNERQTRDMPPGKRMYLVEYVRPEGGALYLSSMKQAMNKSGEMVDDATTGLQRLVGAATASAYGVTWEEDNPAVQEAMERAELYTEQAEDATTPSNIAILALPLALNLVPVGLVAEVVSWRMLGYVVLSDVLTVLPMGIKGFELVFLSGRSVRLITTRITSFATGSTLPSSAVAEVWGVECAPKGGVRRTGIAFLMTALLFLVVGITGEVWTWRWTRRRKKELLRHHLVCAMQNGGGVLQKSVPDDGAEMFQHDPAWTSKLV